MGDSTPFCGTVHYGPNLAHWEGKNCLVLSADSNCLGPSTPHSKNLGNDPRPKSTILRPGGTVLRMDEQNAIKTKKLIQKPHSNPTPNHECNNKYQAQVRLLSHLPFRWVFLRVRTWGRPGRTEIEMYPLNWKARAFLPYNTLVDSTDNTSNA